jgi:16S rRNA (guanine(966)-N(2))-methyltransferase RsmD
MRIIAGKYKKRKLDVLSEAISPTKDSLRETIFNVIASDVIGSSVLDLYSGSGAFALEAISRGAQSADLVDIRPKTIYKNISFLGADDRKKVNIFGYDVNKYIKKAAKDKRKYSLVFIDPPYHKGLLKKSLQLLFDCDILLPEAVILAEHEKGLRIDDLESEFKDSIKSEKIKEYIIFRQIRSHKTTVTLIKKKNKSE